uniref:Uncharacterized protein n=1 Tax=Arcella intermedia TaxID=1963864 RepID=A0A6B2LNA6_9EUKA
MNDASCIPLERFYSSITTIFPVIPDGLPNHIGPFDPAPSPVPSPVANQPTTPTPTPTPTPQNQPSAAPLPSEQPANGVAPEPQSPSNEPSVQPYPGPQAAQYPVWYMPVNWALVGFGGVVIVAALIALCLQRNQKITTRKIPAIMEFE